MVLGKNIFQKVTGRSSSSSRHYWPLFLWKAMCSCLLLISPSVSLTSLCVCVCVRLGMLVHDSRRAIMSCRSVEWWAANRCNKRPEWQLTPLICNNRLVHALTPEAMTHPISVPVCLAAHTPIVSFMAKIYLSQLIPQKIPLQLPVCAPRPARGVAMERSAKELFLNFIIVLITVLLMWLLVKTYQDWSLWVCRTDYDDRDEQEAEEVEG